jgi:hypothetical protein
MVKQDFAVPPLLHAPVDTIVAQPRQLCHTQAELELQPVGGRCASHWEQSEAASVPLHARIRHVVSILATSEAALLDTAAILPAPPCKGDMEVIVSW